MSNLKNKQRLEVLPAGGTPIQPEDPRSAVAWQAEWMQDPAFAGIAHREVIHPRRCEENNSEIRNLHTFFRRETVPPQGAIRQARLYITADDCYKLYLNGDFVGLGPAPALTIRITVRSTIDTAAAAYPPATHGLRVSVPAMIP